LQSDSLANRRFLARAIETPALPQKEKVAEWSRLRDVGGGGGGGQLGGQKVWRQNPAPKVYAGTRPMIKS